MSLNKATQNAKNSIKNVANMAGLGEEYSGLNSQYSELKKFQELFNTATKDEDAYQRFLAKNGITADYAKDKVSGIIGEDVNKLGAKMQAINLFAKPQWEIPSFGMSNTGRTVGGAFLGGLAGYGLGQASGGEYSPFLMGAAGGALGAKAVGPMMIRKYMESNQAIRNLPAAIPAYKYLPYVMKNVSTGE
jgi:hypothetical protein